MASASEPKWLPRLAIEISHREQLREHGGLLGLRDAAALEAAVARPRHMWSYGGERNLSVLAAGYGYGIARSHPFVDGNKRAALLAIYTFLGINGLELEVEETEAVLTMRRLASDELTEDELGSWIKTHVVSVES